MIFMKISRPSDPNINIPRHNLYDAYNQMMDGNTAYARTTIAAFYRDGVKNPRATLYEAKIEQRNITNLSMSVISQTPDPLQKILRNKFNVIMQELTNSDHPLVTTAKKEVNESFKELYPSVKTQKFSHFIMYKTLFPFLEKFKFLLKL